MNTIIHSLQFKVIIILTQWLKRKQGKQKKFLVNVFSTVLIIKYTVNNNTD